MNLTVRLIAIALFLYVIPTQAQNYKFGKISEEELSEKYYPQDSSAVAAVLYREFNVRYDYMQGVGFKVLTDVHERIKIYKKEGFSYATVTERLFISTGSSDKESLKSLKAYTYNLIDGKIEENKLKGSDTFTEEASKYYEEEKFTLPNVKEGSVIEYSYTLESPFYTTLDEIVLQYDIPIVQEEISIAIPEYLVFSPNVKGYINAIPKISRKAGKITLQSKTRTGNNATKFDSHTIDYLVNVAEYSMQNVPALKEERYVNNMNNYRSTVNYELQYVKFPEESIKSFSTTWDKVAETIYNSPNFGKQLNTSRYFKDELPIVLANATNEVEKLSAIYFYVQQNMNWNGVYGKYTDQGVKTAFKEKTGNVADINLMLVAMFNEAGLKSYPVLVSTRNNGVPMFPTQEGFNYVIASVEIDKNIILLDATNKYGEPNMLPVRALNWFGRLIKEDGSSASISLNAKMQSQEINMIQATMSTTGSLEGVMRTIYSDYNAYNYRNSNNSLTEDAYLEKLENKYSTMEIANYSIDNKNNLGKSITEKYEFTIDSQADVIGDKIYFSPTIFKTERENPFKLEERNFPIDFGYPWAEKLMINVKIPEGYSIESVPAPLAINLPNNMGVFKYNISNQNNEIKVVVGTELNTSIIGTQDYAALKEFYRLLVEKETEKVVLSKI